MRRMAKYLTFSALLVMAGCTTSAPWAGGDTLVLPAALGEAVVRVLTAAERCDVQVARADLDSSGGRAILVLFDEWRNPQPESAVLVVAVEDTAGSSAVQVTARSLADFGRQAPAADGHGFPSCACCEAAAAGFDVAVFSPSRALAAGARARACLLGALSR